MSQQCCKLVHLAEQSVSLNIPAQMDRMPGDGHLMGVLNKGPAVDVADVALAALRAQQVEAAHLLPEGQAHHARYLLLLQEMSGRHSGRMVSLLAAAGPFLQVQRKLLHHQGVSPV